MNEEYTSTIKDLLSDPHAEALEWLRAGAENKRRLVEHRSTAQSAAFVERLYSLGAAKVLAVAFSEDSPEQARCRYLLVELPDRSDLRQALFAFEREQVETKGFEGTPDDGQLYLFLDVKGMD